MRLLLPCLLAVALPLGAQATIDPGMSKAAVIARLGKPMLERTLGDDTYVFYRNGAEKRCGMNDIVTLRHDAVTDAVFRSSKRTYTGTSSSPRCISAAEARRGRPTTPANPAGGTVLSLAVNATPKASLYERIGGLPAVQAAVHEMITNAMADSRIKAFFAGIDMVRVDKNLVDFVCSAAGGPCVYSGKSMAKAHEGQNLKPVHFNALVEDLKKGLDKLKVPAAEQKELLAALAATRADVLGK